MIQLIAIYTIISEVNLVKDVIVLYGKNYKILLGDEKVLNGDTFIDRKIYQKNVDSLQMNL